MKTATIVAAVIAWFVLGVAPRALRVVDRPRPIMNLWVSASCLQACSLPASCFSPSRTARWASVPDGTSQPNALRSPDADQPSA